MSGHVHVTDRLSAYLDGALGVRDLAHVQAHLETCANCLRAYEELQALRGLLRGLPEPAMPEGFAERIHWRLQREAGRPLRRSLFDRVSFPALLPLPVRLALVGAMVLLVVGLPLGWMRSAHETPLDSDAYLRDYLMLSADRSLTDEAATTLVTSNVVIPEPQTR